MWSRSSRCKPSKPRSGQGWPVTFNVGRTESGGHDIYAGLFADDLDTVADQLDRVFAKLNADEMLAKPRQKRSYRPALPLQTLLEQAAG
jgi:hypothetical protein